MESTFLLQNIDYLGGTGVLLSPEIKSALQTSLCILKRNGKYKRVYFWGKVIGIKNDYYIAQGLEKDEFSERKTWYSMDCCKWALLPPADEDSVKKALLIHGRFFGDPSYEFEHKPLKQYKDTEENQELSFTLKEEIRLAATISEIDEEARIVPRGSFVQQPTGLVFENRTFEGLSIAEASKLRSYQHFRPAKQLLENTIKNKEPIDRSVDFMDTIDNDIPTGCWSLQFDRGSALVILASLLWPGYSFFHVPDSRRHGSVYFGTGERNIDLPFML